MTANVALSIRLEKRLGYGRLQDAAWLDAQTALVATRAGLWRWQIPGGETWERRMLAGRQMEMDMLPEESLAALEKQAPAALAIEEAIEKHARVVVLGDPGSGKSTLLKHLTLRLAGEGSGRLPTPQCCRLFARWRPAGCCQRLSSTRLQTPGYTGTYLYLAAG